MPDTMLSGLSDELSQFILRTDNPKQLIQQYLAIKILKGSKMTDFMERSRQIAFILAYMVHMLFRPANKMALDFK